MISQAQSPDKTGRFLVPVVLNFRRPEDTAQCLATLFASRYTCSKVFVLNYPAADPADGLGDFGPAVDVVPIEENLGYAGNNNIGIELACEAGADWILLLNEDTILDPECLSRLLELGESDERIGIVGPLVYHFDEPNVIQSAGGLLDKNWESRHIGVNEVDRGQFDRPMRVDWISGCAIMVRREVVEQVGGLDERFFMYWEEIEWCIRAKKAGWKIMSVPGARLWHKGVQRNYNPRPVVTYYAARNRLLTLSIHHAPLRARVSAWFRYIRMLASWTVRPKWREKRQHRDALWIGLMDYLKRSWGKGKL